jgi:membrane-associated phospholipid phosphatase
MRWRRSAGRGPDALHDDWTSHVSSGLALAGFLFLVFVGFTLLAMGPLISLDAYFNLDPPPASWVPLLHVLDRIGQRAVCLPILAVVTFLCCRHRESWRPAWVVAFSVFSLNLVVLILKVLLGRGQPGSADPSFFVGGAAYPSGHTANIVLVYGLCVFLLSRYHSVPRKVLRLLWGAVVLLSVLMVVTSLTLDWHWFADLIAGLLIGSIVLQLTETVDATVPAHAFEQGPRAVLRKVRNRVPRGSAAADAPAEPPTPVPRREAQ